jgi:hypothetical protein
MFPNEWQEESNKHIELLQDVIKGLRAEIEILRQANKNDLLQRVNHHIDFEKLRQDYFNECVDKTSGKSKLYVCLAPHDLFEWFRKKLIGYEA